MQVTQAELAKKIEDDLDGFAKSQQMTKEELASQVKERTGKEVKEYVAERSNDPFLKRMLRRPS